MGLKFLFSLFFPKIFQVSFVLVDRALRCDLSQVAHKTELKLSL